MKRSDCQNQDRILEALGKGQAPEAMEEPLRRHAESCPSCTEIISVCELFQADSRELCSTAPLPQAGRVWWRATLAARRAAAERALRPILIAERVALAVGAGALVALLLFAAPWVAEQLAHSKMFSGTVVYTVSLSSLLVASMVVCVLLMAGALYAMRAEE